MAIVNAFDRVVQDLTEHQGQTTPKYPTGLETLDEKTWGFHESELYIVAGRPGEGKSTALLFFALQFLKADHKVLFFTLEMTAEELIRRMISQICRMENTKLRRNMLSLNEIDAIKAQRNIFAALPLDIVETGYKWLDIEAYVKSLKPKVIVVDFIQMMSTQGYNSNLEALTDYIRNFKKIARQYKAIVLVASQLNRAPIARSDKRPYQEDLRGAGSLEESADCILANYWPWKYTGDDQTFERFEISVLKQRHGPIGRCRLTFNPQHFWFEDLESWELELWDKEEKKR